MIQLMAVACLAGKVLPGGCVAVRCLARPQRKGAGGAGPWFEPRVPSSNTGSLGVSAPGRADGGLAPLARPPAAAAAGQKAARAATGAPATWAAYLPVSTRRLEPPRPPPTPLSAVGPHAFPAPCADHPARRLHQAYGHGTRAAATAAVCTRPLVAAGLVVRRRPCAAERGAAIRPACRRRCACGFHV